MHWPLWLTFQRRRILRRAGKVALAAALATLIAQLLQLQNPWFATLAAIVAMEVTIRASLRSARNSLIGVVVGAAAGLALAIFAKEQAWAVAVAVLVAFVAFGLLRMESAGRQAALVASVIVLVPERVDMTTADFAWVRLAETAIGIGVALSVNAFVLPPRAHRGVRRHLASIYQHLAVMYRTATEACAGAQMDPIAVRDTRREIRADLQEIDALWDEAMSEHPPPEVLAPHWRVTTRRIWEQCAVMASAVDEVADSPLLADSRDEIAELASLTTTALRDVGEFFTTTDGGPIPVFPDLQPAQAALIDRIALEERTAPVSFDESLQVLGFVNAMNTIAVRLDDVAETTDPTAESSPTAVEH